MNSFKRQVRAIQARTGWGFCFVARLARHFGFEHLTEALDGLGPMPSPERLAELGAALNEATKPEEQGIDQ